MNLVGRLQEPWEVRAPLLSEKELLDLISSLLPIGEENAAQLGPSLIEPLQVIFGPVAAIKVE